MKTQSTHLWWALVVFTAAVMMSTLAHAANPDGDLRIEPIAAPNFIVDSNIDTPAGYGPDSAFLGAEICNDGTNDLTDVLVSIGNFDPDGVNDAGTPGTPTPGIYPVEDVDEAANGWLYTGDFSFTHEASQSDATRFIPLIPAGECITQYWLVTYPQVDANGDPVFGENTPTDDDLVIEYDIWTSAYDGATLLSADDTYTGTMRRELSASANKIYPNTTSKVPQEYIDLIESALGWHSITTVIEAGTAGVVEGIWYDMGNVSGGYDADGDLVQDNDLWLQPVGDASRFDPDCFRLNSVTGMLVVSLKDGGVELITVEDQLYFKDLPENTGIVGLIYYEWIPVEGGCSAELTPYQEAASGSENEKFNSDFGTGGAIISSGTPDLPIDKTASPSLVAPGGQVEYTLSTTNNSSQPLGVPDTGAAVVLRDPIPADTTYVAGSADSGNTPPAGASIATLFSTDGGTNWTVDEPVPASSVTDIQWWLSEPLAVGETFTVAFSVTASATPTSAVIDNCGEVAFGSGEAFDEDCETVLITGVNSLSGTVFEDDGADANFGNGIYDEADAEEVGIPAVLVTLYFDTNSDGVLDAGDVFVSSVDSAATTGDYSFTQLPDGNYIVTVDTTDTDIPTGYGITTPEEIAVDLDSASVDLNPVTSVDNDFGFAPPLSIGKSVPTPVLEGETIAYTVEVTNHLAGGGGCASTLLDIDGEAADDQSGWSVSLSADGCRVAVGAYSNSDNGNNSGHVRVYEWNGSTWIQMGLDIDGEAALDRSGGSVSLSADGSRVAIGARSNEGNGAGSGHVRIYEWNGSAWVQMGLDIDGEAALDHFGYSVSLSADGSRVAISANVNEDFGYVRVYEWDGSAWVQMGLDIDGEAALDEFGRSVSLSADGSRVAVGGRLSDDNGVDSGYVRVYEWNGSAWVQMGLDIDGEAASDRSGQSVSLSADGGRVAIGATSNDGNGSGAGHVRVYEWDGSAWVQMGLDIDGEAAGDGLGWSVSLSADGSRVAIGALGNDGNGVGSGHVRVYDWNGSAWAQVGLDIDGEAAGDASGRSVSLSSDGSVLAIGAAANAGNGTDSGQLRVYNLRSVDGVDSGSTTLYDVAIQDTYDPAELSFVSASITADSTTPLGTLTWDDIGPIEGGAKVLIEVTFEVLYGNAGVTIDNDVCVTSSSFSDGTPGNTPCAAETFTLDPAGSISGTVWAEGDAGSTGWTGTTGYENLGTVDFGVNGVTVWLYQCAWDDPTLKPANGDYVDSTDPNYEFGSDCDSQGGGGGNPVGVWTLVATETTDTNGGYKFDALEENGFYYVQVDATTLPGTVSQTAEADEFQAFDLVGTDSVTQGYSCASAPADYTCDDLWGVPVRGGGGGAQPGELGTFFNELGASSSEDITNVNFGYDVAPALFGNVCEDVDGDGVQETGDDGLADWQVDITGPGCSSCTTTTDANGDYEFLNLSAGSYTIVVTIPGGETWTETFETDTTINNSTTVPLVGGEISGSWDFCWTQTGSSTIGDTVYHDWDGDGIQDASDEGIGDVAVSLYRDGALVATTTTDIDGNYLFTTLPAGTYTVVVDESSSALVGTIQTGDPDQLGIPCTACDGEGTASVDGTNSDLTEDFGYQLIDSGTIGDTVFIDLNGDGAQGASDAGIPDITVSLLVDLNGDGTYVLLSTQTTDSNGNYLFENLPATDYRVIVDTADTDLPTTGSGATYTATTATQFDVPLASGETYLDADFGFGPLGSLGDTIFWDSNINGTQDESESGIAGVTVTLTPPAGIDLGNGAGMDITAVTDADGKYLFEDLPAGDYTVSVTPPLDTQGAVAEQTSDPERDGSPCWDDTYLAVDLFCEDPNATYTVTIGVGTVDLSADFGYEPSGVIGDTVWRDINEDGIEDEGEVGIPGVTITVTNGTTTVNVTTDADGHYSVANLGDDTWTVTIDATNFDPGGALEDHAATYDVDTGITSPNGTTDVVIVNGLVENASNTWCLVGETCNLDIDFGYNLTGLNSLAGAVCMDDVSLDGICTTGGESLLEDQTVYLWDLGTDGLVGGGDDTLLGSMLTDVSGAYLFDELPDSNYAVVISTTEEPLSYSSLTTTVSDTPADTLTNTGTSVIQTVQPLSGGIHVPGIDYAFEFTQPLDFGDLPSIYPTELTNQGAGHILDAVPTLYLGTGVDSEVDGEPDPAASLDLFESGVTFVDITSWDEGTDTGSLSVDVVGDGWLVGWIDFNNDGDVTDTGEMIVSQTVTTGTFPITFDIPTGSRLTGSLYQRYRLFASEPPVPELAFSGVVTDGEVEDYQLEFQLDYGDAPDSYETLYGDGARHFIDSNLYLGGIPDREDDGQPTADTTGDGADEDGVSINLIATNSVGGANSASLPVTFTNSGATDAQLVCWIDWNQDGDFLDGDERSNPAIDASGCANTGDATDATFTTGNAPAGCTDTVNVQWASITALPAAGSTVYSRCRLTTDGYDPLGDGNDLGNRSDNTYFFSDASPTPYGTAADGEVEDDGGPLPEPTAVTIGQVELTSMSVTDLLAILGAYNMNASELLALLEGWDPDAAATLSGADAAAILQALIDYLDPDGDGQVAVLRWDTLEERGTIGFYAERWDGDDSWIRINNDLLPGLITAPMGAEYLLADPAAQSGIAYQYRLIELEATGHTRQYGPFDVQMP